MKKEIKPYCCNALILKLLEMEDLEYTRSWRNYEAHRCWFNNSDPISKEEHLGWFENYVKRENDFIFVVFDMENNRIGQLSIYEIDWLKRTAVFGRLVANPSYVKRGMMTKAVKAVILFSQEILSLNKLFLEVKPNNEKAIHIYKKCGFKIDSLNKASNLIMTLSF
jgi:diamine N-acetyltransferase